MKQLISLSYLSGSTSQFIRLHLCAREFIPKLGHKVYSKSTVASSTKEDSPSTAGSLESDHIIRFGARTIFEMPAIKDTIELTDVEQLLFKDLMETVKQANLRTTLRCAGGWVRDKLMGKSSLDIDIALDNMLGKDFAEKVNDYLKAQGQETHSVAVIMSNPEQSKHLETARMKIRGLWIDLVNLRSEEYAHHSRIPTMEFGTPEQDAFRRDFTINSLFYNINQGTIEDLTNKGLDDLRAGIIRTPLPAKETFMDDPLRVLRAVRFASRFGFELEATLLEAAADDQVRDILGHKVSRERIGSELEGVLNGPDPVMGVQILHRLRLFEAVFEVHPSASADVTDEFATAGAALLTAVYDVIKAWEGIDLTVDERRVALLGALLLPLRETKFKTAKGKDQSMASHVVRDSLKWRAKESDAVEALHTVAPRLLQVYRQLQTADDASSDAIKIALGRCIRDLKSNWRIGCMLASLLPAPQAKLLGVDSTIAQEASASLQDSPTSLKASLESLVNTTAASTGQDDASSCIKDRVEVCRDLSAAAEAFGLADCWQWKPLLDGKRVMAAVGMTQGGPMLGRLMDKVVDWQLAHPSGTAEECTPWLLEEYKQLID